MRRLHLIPIIRIASKAEGGVWKIPKEEEINNWVGFLNSLNWVVQNRYVVIGNEPNHANEWGETLDPKGYAVYLKQFFSKLKEASSDFFILPAALDVSAKNQKDTMDSAKFLRLMLESDPTVFESLDGWNSHSYPNPDFSGKETDSGRGTVRTFEWELASLKSLGVEKDLPVFITETGWSNKSFSENDIGKKFEYVFTNVWHDKKIIAVTPFILDYPQAPFDLFSWQKADGSFYSYFDSIKNLPKTRGTPIQIESGQIVGAFAQPVIPLGSDYIGGILARNTGQSIWSPTINTIRGDNSVALYSNYFFAEIEPTHLGLIVFKAAAPESIGIYSQSIFLSGSGDKRVTNSFPLEAYVTKIDESKIQAFFEKLVAYFKLLLRI
jgi:hypothetical protein